MNARYGTVRYREPVPATKLIKGAVVMHIGIRDQATNRVGSINIPIEER
jgi:hypothetical protein